MSHKGCIKEVILISQPESISKLIWKSTRMYKGKSTKLQPKAGVPIQGSRVAMLRGRTAAKCGSCGRWWENKLKIRIKPRRR